MYLDLHNNGLKHYYCRVNFTSIEPDVHVHRTALAVNSLIWKQMIGLLAYSKWSIQALYVHVYTRGKFNHIITTITEKRPIVKKVVYQNEDVL